MLVGLTGGIGSGKTAIAHALEERGYPVYFSDLEAKRIIAENPAVRSQVEYLFGSEVFDGDHYRTDVVAAAVFRDPELLQRLNRIVHPAVCFDVRHWAARQTAERCFVESAILFESGLADECNKVVAVIAPVELRISRAVARDRSARADVERRISAQLTDDELRQRADITLLNDGNRSIADLVLSLEKQL